MFRYCMMEGINNATSCQIVIHFYQNKAHEAKDASSCLIKWLQDGIIRDMLCLTSIFDLLIRSKFHSISLNCELQTDQLKDRPSCRVATVH